MRKEQIDRGRLNFRLPEELLSKETREIINNPKSARRESVRNHKKGKLSTILEVSMESSPRPAKKFFGVKQEEFKEMSSH